jgi:hypothetical protein
MNAFQRWFVRIAASVAPPLGRVLQSAGGTVERLSDQNLMLRTMLDDRRGQLESMITDYREAIALAGGGWMARGQAAVSESAPSSRDTTAVVQCKERLAELELALEDRGWKRQLAIAEWEFSRYGIQQIILISRLYFIKNPLIQRGIKISSYYVFGRGFEVSSSDEDANEILQDFFKDPRNLPELSQRALVQKEESRHTDGNIFWAFFTSPDDGQVIVRTIDALEIEEVITDPNDNAVPWYYHRRWTQQAFDTTTGTLVPSQQEGWYLAMGYAGPKVTEIKGKPVMTDTGGMPIPLLHDKCGSLNKWHFGVPIVYAAIDWARAYKALLEDWCTIQRALARFAWQVETEGGRPAIAALKQALNTTLGNDGTSIEQNPTPTVASTWVSGPGTKMTPVKTSGAQVSPEEGRRLMLMVAAAFGLPETFFGDASTGSLATAQSLDRPTELKFLEAQERWREILQLIGQYVLDRSLKAPGGKLREARAKKPAKKPVTIDVKFPSILEHDIGQRINAIVSAMTLSGFETTGIDEKTGVGLLLSELGVEDVQTVLDAMYPEDEYDPDRTAEDTAQVAPPPGPPGAAPAPGVPAETSADQTPGGQQGAPPGEKRPPSRINPATGMKERRIVTSEAALVRGVAELRRALVALQEREARLAKK